MVHIRTNRGYWRDGGHGYCSEPADAGLFERTDAEDTIKDLGPEFNAKLVAVKESKMFTQGQEVYNSTGEKFFFDHVHGNSAYVYPIVVVQNIYDGGYEEDEVAAEHLFEILMKNLQAQPPVAAIEKSIVNLREEKAEAKRHYTNFGKVLLWPGENWWSMKKT